MPATQNFPTARPSLLLNFARSRQLDPRITFSRASIGTFYNSAGVLQTAAAGQPRFDFNPVTGESLGLLIEEQRVNLIRYSEQFNDSTWLKFGTASVTADSVVAPDGTLTADTLTIPVSSGIYQNQNTVITGSITCSVWLRSSGAGNTVRLLSNTNLSDFTFTTCNLTTTWQRFTLTRTLSAGTTTANLQIDTLSGGTLYAWGAQLEAGAFPTSYIPTVASQVTRSADAASMTGTNFSSWYNQSAGTYFSISQSSYGIHPVGSRAGIFYSSAGDTSNYVSFAKSSGDSSYAVIIDSSSASQASVIAITSSIANQEVKIAGAYELNNFAGSGNGSINTDNSIIPPIVDRILIGRGIDGGWYYNGTIKKLAFYSTRLSNAQLQTLTI